MGFLMLVCMGVAPAQSQQAVSAPAVQHIRHMDWEVVCLGPVAMPAGRVCMAEQSTPAPMPGGREMSLRIRFSSAADTLLMELVLPLGVDLSGSHELRIDRGTPWQVAPAMCLPHGCVVFWTLDNALRRVLHAGEVLEVRYVPFGEVQPRVVRFSLEGFAGAVSYLDASQARTVKPQAKVYGG